MKVRVITTVTYEREEEIDVPTYMSRDEDDGTIIPDYDYNDLYSAWEEQVVIPKLRNWDLREVEFDKV